MEVIEKRILFAPDLDHLPRRVVIKFRRGVDIPYQPGTPAHLPQPERSAWLDLVAQFPGIVLGPYFTSVNETRLRALEQANLIVSPSIRLTSFFAVTCPPGVPPHPILGAVLQWQFVEDAYVEAGPTPPPVNPSDDPRNVSQGFQNPAPLGIDARWVWPEADGAGAAIVDVEQGWTLHHEDLTAAGVGLISGLNSDWFPHGTSVLGVVAGMDNSKGGMGIAPGAAVRVVSQWRTSTVYKTGDAVISALAVMSFGDVLLVEAQTEQPPGSGYVPVEVESCAFAALVTAFNNGVLVVEAAGNGSVNLDAYKNKEGKLVLKTTHTEFCDSKALMVGASRSATPHFRTGSSNFGKRIDCYAWGENVDTCGSDVTGTNTTAYVSSFGGTSSAAAIVAGAAVLIQSWQTQMGRPKFGPADLHSLLRDGGLNTPSAAPMADRIGVMPNLRAIIESIR
ncbi:MAG TPA: S8 family serine peptidase [Planctomycetia bacterium]|nr:S8 family serine peptidase [Planctomycetia bacterium]